MLTVIVTAELEVDFVTWEARYLAHKPVREEAGIEDVFVGKVLNENKFLSVLTVPSVDALNTFMEQNSKFMESVGHKVNTTNVVIAE